MAAREKSCGAVVFSRESGARKYLLIRSLKGHYGFPKGHVEAGESEHETAGREILEETGLAVTFVRGFRRESRYILHDGTAKTVVYFLAEAKHTDVVIQEAEVASAGFFALDEALSYLIFDNDKSILSAANERLTAIEKIL